MPRPTLKDIAERAGVSISTVSYALNDQSTLPLAASTRTRIRQLAREVGYVPNSVARALQSRSSQTIGVLLNKPLTTPRYAAITQGLSEGLAEQGFHLALLHGESAARSIEDARGGRLEGLVFIGHDDHDVPTELAEQVTEHRIPFVALDCGTAPTTGAWSTVDFDYRVGVEQLVAHFASAGVSRIIHVRPNVTSRADQTRTDAMEDVTARQRMTLQVVTTGVDDAMLARVDRHPDAWSTYADGIANRLDAEVTLPTDEVASSALVCSWGGDLESVYSWALRRGGRLRVGALASGVLEPRVWQGLTYSRLPFQESGRRCAEAIITAGITRTVLTPTLDTGSDRI